MTAERWLRAALHAVQSALDELEEHPPVARDTSTPDLDRLSAHLRRVQDLNKLRDEIARILGPAEGGWS